MYLDTAATSVFTQAVGKPTSKVLTWRPTRGLTQVRNLSVAIGKIVIGNLHDLMSSPDIAGRTQAKRSLCARCVNGDSWGAITWQSTLGVTSLLINFRTGRWKWASWTVSFLQYLLCDPCGPRSHININPVQMSPDGEMQFHNPRNDGTERMQVFMYYVFTW